VVLGLKRHDETINFLGINDMLYDYLYNSDGVVHLYSTAISRKSRLKPRESKMIAWRGTAGEQQLFN